MEFVVSKSDLKTALNHVTIALSGNAKDPATSHALVMVEEQGGSMVAKIAATDRFVFCETALDIRSGTQGKMLIPGQALVALSAEVEDGDIQFFSTSDSIEVRAGRAALSLPTIAVDLFPYPNDDLSKVQFSQFDTTALQEAIKFSKVFVGTDKDKPDLMIAEMRNKKLMAADALRIGVYKADVFPDAGFVIQHRGISGALDFLKMESGENVLIGRSPNFTWWRGLRAKLAFRTDERTFPEEVEKSVSKVDGENHFKIQQACLERMVSRLKISLDDTSSKMTFSLSGVGEGDLKVQTVNARGKTSEESVPVVRTGGSEDVSFSLGWKDLLSVIKSDLFKESEITLTYDPGMNLLKVSREYEAAEVVGLVALRA